MKITKADKIITKKTPVRYVMVCPRCEAESPGVDHFRDCPKRYPKTRVYFAVKQS